VEAGEVDRRERGSAADVDIDLPRGCEADRPTSRPEVDAAVKTAVLLVAEVVRDVTVAAIVVVQV
jgi:hypothetical protein